MWNILIITSLFLLGRSIGVLMEATMNIVLKVLLYFFIFMLCFFGIGALFADNQMKVKGKKEK